MVYTFQISDVSTQSHDVINMLLSISKEYDFLKVLTDEDNDELTIEQERELDQRYELFLENPKNGRTWNEVKQYLLSK